MSEHVLVDWQVAERAAELVGGLGSPLGRSDGDTDAPVDAPALAAACAESLEAIASYTGLEPTGSTPAPELVDRRQWARNGLETLAIAARPLEQRVAGELGLPGPFGTAARKVVGTGIGAEAGVAVGYAARHVLGQYDVAVIGPQRPARLLFVGPNLTVARLRLETDEPLFVRWIALHEMTHVAQFEGVDWLLGHLRELVERLIGGTAAGLDSRAVVRAVADRLRAAPRELARALLRGELLRSLGNPAQRTLFDRLQATMSAIEGHAEHVMDACGPGFDERLVELRRRLDARRQRRGGLGEVIARLLGIDLKLRQYELGKAFCDGVADTGGPEALELLWRSPAHLPDLDELERPRDWLERVAAIAA
ncbi:MAG: zinc-dependent metalloprotease [Solirubrobacterales bacterium]